MWNVSKVVPSLVIELDKFRTNALAAPLPTGLCIAKGSFFASIKQSISMLDSVQRCARKEIKSIVDNMQESTTVLID